MPDPRVAVYEKRLFLAYRFERARKYASLLGVGAALWLNDLIDLAIDKVGWVERWIFSWLPRSWGWGGNAHAVLVFLNQIFTATFILFTAYLAYWAYMDTFVRQARGEAVWSVRRKVVVAIAVNLALYAALSLFVSPLILRR